ncbi:hypothetical protein [Lacipirellula parvula]|uniref:Uncharacterized protein n=1 Tax=Lacipirellula parvula TaxID=2650471 RepID=A0A5K7XAD7_9BACT|nr:hypothetical protein [Lacipirellula parvula]BBO33385.1 hypothetical protein PLANPX_2997 [Lacipirellula parvula]
MSTAIGSCREARGEACKAAHIGGCVAAIVVIAIVVPAKLGGYLPAGMSSVRLLLFPVLAYGLVVAAMLWKLGRAMKRSQAVQDEVEIAAARP